MIQGIQNIAFCSKQSYITKAAKKLPHLEPVLSYVDEGTIIAAKNIENAAKQKPLATVYFTPFNLVEPPRIPANYVEIEYAIAHGTPENAIVSSISKLA